MRIAIFIVETTACVLALVAGVWLALIARKAATPRFRTLSLGLGGLCLALAAAAAHRATLLAAHAGWISMAWKDRLLGGWNLAIAILFLLLVAWVVVLAWKFWLPASRADRMVSRLSDRIPREAHLSRARLTAREGEVLELIGRGVLSDGDLAQALFISPATAATHVQNILRKTGLHSRRELMLMSGT
jgi:DNA-binding CsgD family transcriptional regulator